MDKKQQLPPYDELKEILKFLDGLKPNEEYYIKLKESEEHSKQFEEFLHG